MVKIMKRFKSKKKKSFKIKVLIFIIIFSLSFYYIFSYFVDPSILLKSIKNRYFNNNDIVTWYINDLFGSVKEDNGLGKTEYIPDPNPEENKHEPIIYLYNTHQSEEYYVDLLMEHDIMPSVMTASYILREKLNNLKINTMVETNNIKNILDDHGWNYTKSYEASRTLLEQAKINNPTLNVFIDLHRDSIPYENSTLQINDTTYAKVLFVIGTDYENFEKNKEFALKISNAMNEKVPGISKGILEKGGSENNGIYNQDFDPKTVLIEIGSSYNYITEVSKTIDVLAESIALVVGE